MAKKIGIEKWGSQATTQLGNQAARFAKSNPDRMALVQAILGLNLEGVNPSQVHAEIFKSVCANAQTHESLLALNGFDAFAAVPKQTGYQAGYTAQVAAAPKKRVYRKRATKELDINKLTIEQLLARGIGVTLNPVKK